MDKILLIFTLGNTFILLSCKFHKVVIIALNKPPKVKLTTHFQLPAIILYCLSSVTFISIDNIIM